MYRTPTTIEREFLHIVTLGNEQLARQVESCDIADYDVTGWCHVKVLGGPPSPRHMIDGPALDLTPIDNVGVSRPNVPDALSFIIKVNRPQRHLLAMFKFATTARILPRIIHWLIRLIAPTVPAGAPRVYRLETILWMTDGMLSRVEIISYGEGNVIDPYRLFVEVADSDPKRLQYSTTES